MRSPAGSIKREFLQKWVKGLQVYSSRKKEMSILERQKVIKLSADVAMASTRISTSSWSRALMTKVSNDAANQSLVAHVLGSEYSGETLISTKKKDFIKKHCFMITSCNKNNIHNRVRSKKILRKSRRTTIRRMRRKAAAHVVVVEGTTSSATSTTTTSNNIAKRLVMKRTEVLKKLVPGGEFMDEISLMRETLDYILSLRLQVDIMSRTLANATPEFGSIMGAN